MRTRPADPLEDLLAALERSGSGRGPGASSSGPRNSGATVSVAFTTRQGARHTGRSTSYRNEVLSLRVGSGVGSAAVEPGSLDDEEVHACVGRSVADLLDHPLLAVRVAVLDAWAMDALPHPAGHARQVTLAAGTSAEKSTARARAVVDLLPAGVERVAVVGVVNSLLQELRARGTAYLPCDLKGGRTEWDEPVHVDAHDAARGADALLVSGMTLANGTLEGLREHAAAYGKPLVVFAQTASALLPHLIGDGVTAVSAEPYPFFWLDGGPTTLHLHTRRPEVLA